MKTSKLFLASVLAIAGATMATAQTTVFVTGSTAFRAESHQAIIRSLGGTACKFAYVGSTLNKAGQAIFYGTVAGVPGQVVVKASWSGSVAGLLGLINSTPITNFLDTTTYAGSANATGGSPTFGGGTAISTTPVLDASNPAPTYAMADNFGNESPNGTGGQVTTAQLTGAGITENIIGVVPFVWVRNAGAPTSISNMTSQLAQALLALGSLPLSFWTNNNADTTQVYVVGRDQFSGSRVVTFSETGFGVLNTPQQNFINGNPPTAGAVTAITAAGTSGYSSGGNVATALSDTGSNNAGVGGEGPGWAVGYLAFSDASTVTNGAAIIPYNGSTFSTAAVQNGNYSFWGYEHLDTKSSASANQATVVTAIQTNLTNTDVGDFGFGVLFPTMNVSRSVDGGVIFHN